MSRSRFLSAIVAIALALGMIVLGGWYFTLCFGVIIYLGQLEYFELARTNGGCPSAENHPGGESGVISHGNLCP
ncbi:hypothetical protein [Neosynechococcus sphagnicola]|uniref:hypothetical protein n=1 Tax=Neosynechococcus sphagnicola TaxID=1501145 RepID=UPI003084676C